MASPSGSSSGSSSGSRDFVSNAEHVRLVLVHVDLPSEYALLHVNRVLHLELQPRATYLVAAIEDRVQAVARSLMHTGMASRERFHVGRTSVLFNLIGGCLSNGPSGYSPTFHLGWVWEVLKKKPVVVGGALTYAEEPTVCEVLAALNMPRAIRARRVRGLDVRFQHHAYCHARDLGNGAALKELWLGMPKHMRNAWERGGFVAKAHVSS
jgi:hypothetical protein